MLQVELARFEHFAVLISQDGQQDFVGQFAFDRPPVDVEEVGIRGVGPIFQQIHPPRVGMEADMWLGTKSRICPIPAADKD